MFVFLVIFLIILARFFVYFVLEEYHFQEGLFHERCGYAFRRGFFDPYICPKCGQKTPKLERIGYRRTFFFRTLINRNHKEI